MKKISLSYISIFTILAALFIFVPMKGLKADESDPPYWELPSSPSGSANKGRYNGAALLGDSVYFVGSRPVSPDTKWRIEKRNRADGAQTSSLSESNADRGSAVDAVADSSEDHSGLYVTGYKKFEIGLFCPDILCYKEDTWVLQKYSLSNMNTPVWTSPDAIMPSGQEVSIFDFSAWFGTSSPTDDLPSSPVAMAKDESGIYMAGIATSDYTVGIPLANTSSWIVQKNSLNGSLMIWNKEYTTATYFGFLTMPSQYMLIPRDIAVSGGKVYIGGYFYTDSKIQSVLIRMDATNPVMTPEISKKDDFGSNGHIEGLAVYNNTLYVAGSNFDPSNLKSKKWIVQKRSLNDLSLDKTIEVDDNGSLNDIGASPDGLFLVGRVENGSNNDWRVEKRNLNDLTLTGGWSVTKDFVSDKADEAIATAIEKGEIYTGGYQNTKYIRAELRGYLGSCAMEASPAIVSLRNISEGSESTLNIQRTASSSDIFCNCSHVRVNKLSGPDGVITFDPNPASFNTPITMNVGTIDSCTQDFSFEVVGDPLTDPKCADLDPINFDVTVVKRCSISCTPNDQDVVPGQTVQISGETSFPGSPLSWSISSGSEYVESHSTSSSNPFQLTLSPDSALKNVSVNVQNCCGNATCDLNSTRAGWIETNP
jgi:hypothetical protein